MTASHLVQTLQIRFSAAQHEKLNKIVSVMKDTKVIETIKHGIGYHHAGNNLSVVVY